MNYNLINFFLFYFFVFTNTTLLVNSQSDVFNTTSLHNLSNLNNDINNTTDINKNNNLENNILNFSNYFLFFIAATISLSLYYFSNTINPILKFLFRLNIILIFIQYFEYVFLNINHDLYFLINFIKYPIIIITIEKLLNFRELFDFNLLRKSKFILFLGVYIIYYILFFTIEENNKSYKLINTHLLIVRFTLILFYSYYILRNYNELINLLITCSDLESNTDIAIKIFNPNIKELELFFVYRTFYNILFTIFSLILFYGVLLFAILFENSNSKYYETIHFISDILYKVIISIYILGIFYILKLFNSYMKESSSDINLQYISNETTNDEDLTLENRISID